MKYAVISDIHSNWEALSRAYEEIQKRSVDEIVCLGDVVGYGANPSEVLAFVRRISSEIILGNHDRAVEDVKLREEFNDWAREAIEWTAGVLSPEEKKQIRQFTPMIIDRDRHVSWTHGSAHEPDEFHYLFNEKDASSSFRVLETDFCFFGHTHLPSLFSTLTPSLSPKGRGEPACRTGRGEGKLMEARYLTAGTYHLAKGERYLINPGSVGQPRDRNPKLSFALFDSSQLMLEIVRLDYDNRKAAEKIRKAGLPTFLADRLL
ncbi:MAG: metallophosphoesterase family protein [Candidatus Omnitrophica bacterium]|nr:metallophosphoesterase family protein [Candidatus Omnitrophota bacterium]